MLCFAFWCAEIGSCFIPWRDVVAGFDRAGAYSANFGVLNLEVLLQSS